MPYEPTNWKSGDVVTSAKLNKLEKGVEDAGGVLIVHATTEGDVITLDKTWQEIHDSMLTMIVKDNGFMMLVFCAFIDAEAYLIYAFDFDEVGGKQFSCNDADEYPYYED